MLKFEWNLNPLVSSIVRTLDCEWGDQDPYTDDTGYFRWDWSCNPFYRHSQWTTSLVCAWVLSSSSRKWRYLVLIKFFIACPTERCSCDMKYNQQIATQQPNTIYLLGSRNKVLANPARNDYIVCNKLENVLKQEPVEPGNAPRLGFGHRKIYLS
jgi:hypothetical protein